MNKKIILVNSSLTDGGSERALSLVANALTKNGYIVKMLLVRNKKITYSLNPAIEVVQLSNKGKGLRKALYRLYEMRTIFKKSKAEYVVSYMFDINAFTILSALNLNKKIIISERSNPEALKGLKKIKSKLIEYFLYPLASQIIFQTEYVRKQYSSRLRIKSVVIPNMIGDISSYLIPFENRNEKIIAVGRLVPQKNFRLLIDAFKEIHKEFPKVNLEIYGEGLLREQLQKQINESHLENRVILKGYTSDVLAEVSKARIYINSSDYEGISNAMLEALALGIPTIATDCPVGGASLAIKDGFNGLLVPIGDEKALSNAIIKLLSDEVLSRKISENAIMDSKRFSEENLLKIWEESVLKK